MPIARILVPEVFSTWIARQAHLGPLLGKIDLWFILTFPNYTHTVKDNFWETKEFWKFSCLQYNSKLNHQSIICLHHQYRVIHKNLDALIQISLDIAYMEIWKFSNSCKSPFLPSPFQIQRFLQETKYLPKRYIIFPQLFSTYITKNFLFLSNEINLEFIFTNFVFSSFQLYIQIMSSTSTIQYSILKGGPEKCIVSKICLLYISAVNS